MLTAAGARPMSTLAVRVTWRAKSSQAAVSWIAFDRWPSNLTCAHPNSRFSSEHSALDVAHQSDSAGLHGPRHTVWSCSCAAFIRISSSMMVEAPLSRIIYDEGSQSAPRLVALARMGP